MREIKFRAWGVFRPHFGNPIKEMRHDVIVKDGCAYVWEQDFDASINSPSVLHKCDAVLMQCTGLKDRNGKEIYEGDIVLCPITIQVDDDAKDFSYYRSDDKGIRTKHCCKPKSAVVQYNLESGCWEFKHHTGKSKPSWVADFNDLEVVGNIHENPEQIGDTE